MKLLTIAFHELRRQFRSGFLLVMMFAVPLLITAIMFFAFGNPQDGFTLPQISVQVVNLDRGTGAFQAGASLLAFLNTPELAELVQVTPAGDEASALAAVARGEAGVAIVIPPELTAAAVMPGATAAIVVASDPALSIGPGIVAELVSRFTDGLNGSRIATGVTADQLQVRGLPIDPQAMVDLARSYGAWLEARQQGEVSASLQVRAPPDTPAGQGFSDRLLALTMLGQMLFFVFFAGANSATGILKDQEDGTLARLRATPTASSTVLGGKFLAVALTLLVQVVVLLILAALIFGIRWGRLPSVALAVLALILVAAGFGLWLMSLVRSYQQAGPVIGVVLTLTGVAGGLVTATVSNLPSTFDRAALFTPQGWVMRVWERTLGGATASELLAPLAVCLAIGATLFALGAQGLRRRFV